MTSIEKQNKTKQNSTLLQLHHHNDRSRPPKPKHTEARIIDRILLKAGQKCFLFMN